MKRIPATPLAPGLLAALLATAPLAAGLLALAGCAQDEAAQKPPAPSAQAADPKAELTARIDLLAGEWWDLLMRTHPTWATEVGDHRYDDKLPDVSATAREATATEVRGLLQKADAMSAHPGHPALDAQPRLTLALLRRELSESLERHELGLAEVDINQMSGPQADFAYFAHHQHPMRDARDVENLIERYRGIKTWAEDQVANLRGGLQKGRTAPRVVIERVVGQLDELLANPDPKASVFAQAAERIPASVPAEQRAGLTRGLEEATASGVLAGFAHYRDFLKNEYLGGARDDVSLSSIPGGPDAYGFLVRHHTTTSLTPEAIHQMGLDELARIEAEMAKLAKERGHEGDVRSFLDALRADQAQYAPSREALLETFRVALKRADAALPSAFGRLPKLAYRVEPMDAQREKDAPAAYYQPGSLQAGRDGVFVANLYRFEERPLMNSAVLAFHEAVPGHHLQIAIGQEIEGIPRFRAEGGTTAFVEGWALYSERLASELELYESLEERVGFLGFAAWRASRLVVDTGLHHKGWTRQHAVDFLASHTTLGKIDVENEIDRYIAWPGQALAYMVGCLRILELREELRKELGERFSLPAFHDALLGAGPLPLELVALHVRRELGAAPRVAGAGR